VAIIGAWSLGRCASGGDVIRRGRGWQGIAERRLLPHGLESKAFGHVPIETPVVNESTHSSVACSTSSVPFLSAA
jgi:hypothetical protein